MVGAGGSSTGSNAKAKQRLTMWDTGVEVSGPAQKECTVDAMLELKHMIHVHTCYQQRIENSDVSQSQHTQSSFLHPFMVGFSSHHSRSSGSKLC